MNTKSLYTCAKDVRDTFASENKLVGQEQAWEVERVAISLYLSAVLDRYEVASPRGNLMVASVLTTIINALEG